MSAVFHKRVINCLLYIKIYLIINTEQTKQIKLTAQRKLFVRLVPTVVGAVAHPVQAHAQMVGALKLILRAPATPRVACS